MEIVSGLAATIIGGLVLWYITEARKRNKTQLDLSEAPRNLLQHIAPGTSVARMREILGAPFSENEGQYSYRFSNLLLQVASSDSTSIDSVGLILPKLSKRSRFDLYPLKMEIGAMTLADVLDQDTEIEYDCSSKHTLLYIDQYFGNPGFYREYSFGLYGGPGAKYPWEKVDWNAKEKFSQAILKT